MVTLRKPATLRDDVRLYLHPDTLTVHRGQADGPVILTLGLAAVASPAMRADQTIRENPWLYPEVAALTRDEISEIVAGLNGRPVRFAGRFEVGFPDGDRRHNGGFYLRFTKTRRAKHLGTFWTTGRYRAIRAADAEALVRKLNEANRG